MIHMQPISSHDEMLQRDLSGIITPMLIVVTKDNKVGCIEYFSSKIQDIFTGNVLGDLMIEKD
jgi:hypothetical protein